MKNFKRTLIYTTAIAAIFLFAQCTKENTQTTTAQCNSAVATANGIKIAFVDIDSLLTNYELSITINKEMLRKEENMRMTLSEKAKDIQADIEDFQRKIENNVYATQKRAEEEQARILKRREDYDKLSERLAGELAAESQKNNLILRDSINAYLKDYNKEQGYDLIISRVGDNLLYANEALDITEDVIEGLNERYKANN
ncbi:MAG: OmpH family outer membrane protein [Bacteroidaceae bacterium]|nr:OmpH family outer membrane protein [Bacteroidaceae bacterium]